MFELIVQQFVAKINKIYNNIEFTKIIFNRLNKNVKKRRKRINFC